MESNLEWTAISKYQNVNEAWILSLIWRTMDDYSLGQKIINKWTVFTQWACNAWWVRPKITAQPEHTAHQLMRRAQRVKVHAIIERDACIFFRLWKLSFQLIAISCILPSWHVCQNYVANCLNSFDSSPTAANVQCWFQTSYVALGCCFMVTALSGHTALPYGSFHAKTTTFQKSCQVTPSDFAHIHTICSSIGRMNTQKKSAANSLQFRKYSSSKIWPDPPFLASVRRVIDLSDLWPAFISVCNK